MGDRLVGHEHRDCRDGRSGSVDGLRAGCPTWPRCTEDSYVSHPELGIHGAIEFGNRLFTLVLIIAAALTFISAMLYRENGRPRTDLRWLAAALALGIPLQGVIGGITVLTQLNPYVVGLHLLSVDGADLARGLAGAEDLAPRTGGVSGPPWPSPVSPSY